MNSPEEATLLDAILAQPADNQLRLVYADWLEQQASPAAIARAALIRIQVQRELLAEGDPRRIGLEVKAYELRRRWADLWLPPAFPWPQRVEWIRGMPEVADFSRLAVNGASLARLSEVTGLRGLSLEETSVTDHALEPLAEVPLLEWLNLYNCHLLTDAAADHLARLSHLQMLILTLCRRISRSAINQLRRQLPQATIEAGGHNLSA